MTTPCSTLLLFGATGDLAKRMLLPSLFGLDADELLPAKLRVVATARSDLDHAGFRAVASEALERFIEPERRDPATMARFLDRLDYVPLDASDPSAFGALAQTASRSSCRPRRRCSSRPSAG